MYTLQNIYQTLTDSGFVVVKCTRLEYVKKDLFHSLFALNIFCPVEHTSYTHGVLRKLCGDNFKVFYFVDNETFHIIPLAKDIQFIANAIETSNTDEQFNSCERMIGTSFEYTENVEQYNELMNLHYKYSHHDSVNK